MLNFISENIGTIVVFLMVAASVTAAAVKMASDKKSGKSGCCGDCGKCGGYCNSK